LKIHIRQVHNNNDYEWWWMQRKLKSTQSLHRHINIQHRQSIRLFDCDKCGKSFIQSSSLNSHISSFYSSNTNQCQCIDCGKYYKSIINLRQHRQRVHVTNRCDKEYKNYKRFIKHIIRSIHN
jgi:uncharacterized Zn-finger protein